MAAIPKPPCRGKCAKVRPDMAIWKKLETGFLRLQKSSHMSLLKKYLSKEMLDRLKYFRTNHDSTLLDIVQSGMENPDCHIGVYAPDQDAYGVFKELFDPIIEEYHGGFSPDRRHPPTNWGDVGSLQNLDPDNSFIVSTRIRCARSLRGFPFNPRLTPDSYREIEGRVTEALSKLTGELAGNFYPLAGMDEGTKKTLIDDHFLFKEGDRFLQSANACRFWPTGRGIYHNGDKTFLVWVNEEDHLRVISMEQGGNLGSVYARLVAAVNELEKNLKFIRDDRLGFLTFCPTNLGTTIRASVHIKLPKLASDKPRFEEIADRYRLQVRGTSGENTEAEEGVYDISNKQRLGLSEYDAVKTMHDGILELIRLEREE